MTCAMIFGMANSVSVFVMSKDMTNRGVVINTAWVVTASAVLGDHLGFTAGFAPELLGPVILGKLAGGISAVLLALVLTRKEQ